MSIQLSECRANDTAKIQKGLFIHLVSAEQFGVIAKIAKKPGELPQSTFGAVEAPIERNRLERGGF